jgi:hypothetical protein
MVYLNYLRFGSGLVVLLVLVFGVLQWLHISVGSFLDWVVGITSFAWLLVIVTVPWNIYFEAKEALADAATSQERGIRVELRQIEYVSIVARRSLVIIIALHLLSAIGLYTLAATGISAVGYVSSGAALLLTVLRPAVRTYQYFSVRLAAIRGQFNYPREDIVEFRNRFNRLQETVDRLEQQLNLNDPRSWVATQQRQLEALRNDLTRVAATQEEFKTINQAEHDRLAREAKTAIAQLTTDGQFLDHVREIIRFFKTA